jgi:hypothetical protein
MLSKTFNSGIILLYLEEQAAEHGGFRRNALVLAYVNVGILPLSFMFHLSIDIDPLAYRSCT